MGSDGAFGGSNTMPEKPRTLVRGVVTDGIFCEFAVFELAELPNIPYAPGRLVWHHPSVSPQLAQPAPRFSQPRNQPIEWHLGEALTNLLVGLKRFNRGEKISAMRFVQGYALDRVIDLAQHLEKQQPHWADPFAAERRFEQGFPHTAQQLPQMAQGYAHTPASALAILHFLEQHFAVNPAIANAIRQEAQGG